MARLPKGTVTFLFTDIEGSTKLLQRLGDDYARALGEHQALLRAAWAAHGGVEIDTAGDGFFVAFPSAPQAVAAAVDATHALAAHAWPEGAALRVRIGLHTGTPQLVGDHYVGIDVHHAARIMAAGHGGQILLSAATRVLCEHALPGGTTLRDLGTHRLKDLREPEPLAQVVLPGLPADFPPLKTLDTHPHNLPVQPTPLLGREAQLAALAALVRRDGVRLVTLTGPGGIGKTRLAVQVAAEVMEDFPDGVFYVRLSRLTDPALVIPTIAQTLGLREQGSQSLADLLRAHVADKRLLLLLDNFEQVVGAAGEVAALLADGPGLKLLVTSRLPLHLRGERVQAVPPLPLAAPKRLPPLEQLTQYAAVALFIERAQAAQDTFTVTAANAPVIAQICTQLDGLPLAIELAAARVRVLPPEALLARLSSQLKLLTGGARDLEARQQTMRAAIAWSDDLLAPAERMLFRRLAVFAGGCDLEAAEAVCAAPEGAGPLDLDLLEGLGVLVDHSLIQQREEGGEPRFGMLHVIHEYARERLEASGEAEALRQAHAGYYRALAERAEPGLTGPEVGTWVNRLEQEHDNLRAALSWACAAGAAAPGAAAIGPAETGLRVVGALYRFWRMRGHLREGRAWVEQVLALSPLPAITKGETSGKGKAARTTRTARSGAEMEPALALQARAFFSGGYLASWQQDGATAAAWLEQAVALGRAGGDRLTVARAFNTLGYIALDQGDLERAAAHFAESLVLMRALDDRQGIAAALNNLGEVARFQGDLERAARAYAEALALARAEGDRNGSASSMTNLGAMAWQRGELAQAEALGREALALVWEIGALDSCASGLELLAHTAEAAGQGERAARLLGAAAALRETLGIPQPPLERGEAEQTVARARAALGEDAWAAAFAAGHALSLEQAIAEALGASDGAG